MDHIAFVGPGRVGLSLGQALLDADAVDSITYFGRRPDPPSHPLFREDRAAYVWGLQRLEERTRAVFLSVPDERIEEVAHGLAGRGEAPAACSAFHLSGAMPADPLGPLHGRGYSVGTLHPLQSVTFSQDSAHRLVGCAYAISGEPAALSMAQRLVSALQGKALRVPAGRRPLYHAAAVLASNYLVVLMDAAVHVLQGAGLDEEEARDALLPLARGTLANVEELGTREALTGPVARGDVDTVALHLRVLEEPHRRLYQELAEKALELAGEDLSSESREELIRILGERG